MSEPQPEYRTREKQPLSQPAAKLARRLDTLPVGCTYILVLSKAKTSWLWAITEKAKTEVAAAG